MDAKFVLVPLWSWVLKYERRPCGYDDRDGVHLSAWKYENCSF